MRQVEFVIPKGTVCKLGGSPFELAQDTKAVAGCDIYKLFLSQSEHCVSKPNHAADLPSSTANSSSSESKKGFNESLTCVGVSDESTIQVESKQCQ